MLRSRMLLIFKKTSAYHKPLVITVSIIVLNILYGFDARFTIINLIWLLPFNHHQHEKNSGSLHR